MKTTTYQRVHLAGKWYMVIAEDEFRALMTSRDSSPHANELDALNLSDQRLADRLLERRRKCA